MKKQKFLICILLVSLCSCSIASDEKVYTIDSLEREVFDDVVIENKTICYFHQFKDLDEVEGYLKQEHFWAIDYVREMFNLSTFSKSTAESYYIAISNINGPDQRILELQIILSMFDNNSKNKSINKLLNWYEFFESLKFKSGMNYILQRLETASAFCD